MQMWLGAFSRNFSCLIKFLKKIPNEPMWEQAGKSPEDSRHASGRCTMALVNISDPDNLLLRSSYVNSKLNYLQVMSENTAILIMLDVKSEMHQKLNQLKLHISCFLGPQITTAMNAVYNCPYFTDAKGQMESMRDWKSKEHGEWIQRARRGEVEVLRSTWNWKRRIDSGGEIY